MVYTCIHIKRNTNYYTYIYIEKCLSTNAFKDRTGVMVQSLVEPHLSPKLGPFHASKE